jgi:hypothetical protein
MEFSQNNFKFAFWLRVKILFQKTSPYQMALRQFVAYQNDVVGKNWT